MFRLFPERNSSASGLTSLFLRTLVLLQQASAAYSWTAGDYIQAKNEGYDAICFNEIGNNAYPGLNMLQVNHDNPQLASQVIAGGYGAIPVTAVWNGDQFTLQESKKTYQAQFCQYDLYKYEEAPVYLYGKHLLVFDVCHFGYYPRLGVDKPDPVIQAMIKQNCEAFPTVAPDNIVLSAYASITAAAALLFCTRRCYVQCRHQRRIAHIQATIAADSESRREAQDQQWVDLNKRVIELRDEDGVDNAVSLYQDLKSDQDKYTCPIGLKVMTEPLQLACGHNFEAIEIHNWIGNYHKDRCPCCRTKINLEAARPNSELKAEIETRFQHFSSEQLRMFNSVFHTPCSSLSASADDVDAPPAPVERDLERGLRSATRDVPTDNKIIMR